MDCQLIQHTAVEERGNEKELSLALDVATS
jgi:hypothetical protein